jgi:RimJ/RimL family protein N-acetyltransferase
MFGPKMTLTKDNITVVLKPFEKEELLTLVPDLQGIGDILYTSQTRGQNTDTETAWYERVIKNSSYIWGVFFDGKLIGVTSLFSFSPISCKAVSGIMLANSKYQGKGIGTIAHIMRTYYAADFLNLNTIQSSVYSPNISSFKALEKVGYINTGSYLRSVYKKGEYLDETCLTWINPFRINVLYPEGIPEQYKDAVKRAEDTLLFARENVSLK